MKKAEEWLSLLYAYGESQLSRSLWGTESDLIKQLPPDMIIKESLIEDENIYRARKYKTKFFDPQKKLYYDQVVKIIKQKGISLWKPVWDYLIQQVPEAYVFFGESIFTEFVPLDVRYKKTDDFSYEPYLACCVTNSNKLFKKTISLEEERDKKINKLQKKLNYITIIALISFMISFFFNDWFALIVFSCMFTIIGMIFRSKRNIVKRFINLTRKQIFEILFPNKTTVKDLIVDKHTTIRIDLFQNEQLGVKRFEHLSKEKKLTPSYVQYSDFIKLSVEKQQEREFNQIIGKKQNYDPIIYFEQEEVVVIPFDGLDNHPIMKYIIENIKISELDIPTIIEDYLEKTLQIEFDNYE